VQASIDFEDDVEFSMEGFIDKVKFLVEDVNAALLTTTRGQLLQKGLQASSYWSMFMCCKIEVTSNLYPSA
jgi:hypothetical protein